MRILPLLLVAGCSLPNMPVASTLAPQQPMSRSVMSRGDVRFGSFRVTGWSAESGGETWHGDVLPEMLHHGAGYDDYSFNVEEAGQPPRAVRCSAAMRSDSLKEGRTTITSAEQSLRCAIWLTPGPDYARLAVGGDGTGSLVYGGRSFKVEGRNMQGHAETLEPAGYAVSDGSHDVLVAQRVNGGAVWIAGDAAEPDRGLYGATAAALLVYEPISAH